MDITTTPIADFEVRRAGSLFLLHPLNDVADQHLQDNTGGEAQWFGGALVVEHRYAQELAAQLIEAGFLVR